MIIVLSIGFFTWLFKASIRSMAESGVLSYFISGIGGSFIGRTAGTEV
jgi:hypothetical protein